MRSVLRNAALSLLGGISKIGNGVHILAGHYISKEISDPSQFYNLLNSLTNYCDFINIEEASELLQLQRHVKDKLIAFSFDDGFQECFTQICPILKDFKTDAIFFVVPELISGNKDTKDFISQNRLSGVKKGFMNASQIKQIVDDGFKIGSHSYSHINLNTNDSAVLNREIIQSKVFIENLLGIECNYFAWPYGRMSDLSKDALTLLSDNYTYIYASDVNYNHQKLIDDKIINRRHFEGDWKISHLRYFLR